MFLVFLFIFGTHSQILIFHLSSASGYRKRNVVCSLWYVLMLFVPQKLFSKALIRSWFSYFLFQTPEPYEILSTNVENDCFCLMSSFHNNFLTCGGSSSTYFFQICLFHRFRLLSLCSSFLNYSLPSYNI